MDDVGHSEHAREAGLFTIPQRRRDHALRDIGYEGRSRGYEYVRTIDEETLESLPQVVFIHYY